MTSFSLLLWTGAGAVVLMTLLWLWQVYRRDATIVDVGWACGLFLTVLFYAYVGDGNPWRRLLFACLMGAWALRIAGYLFFTRVRGRRDEDGRYRRMRAAMGRYAHAGFFLFFQAQALFIVLFAIPFVGPVRHSGPLGVTDVLAVIVWAIALTGESISDYQLLRHRSDPANAGTTCQHGLWRYSRHPNYFFEWLQWFTCVFLSIGSRYWLMSLWGPVCMFVFLWKVTGIPHTEKNALAHRPDYAEYQRTTSVFFPWFPRKKEQNNA